MRKKPWIWSLLLKKSLMENFIFLIFFLNPVKYLRWNLLPKKVNGQKLLIIFQKTKKKKQMYDLRICNCTTHMIVRTTTAIQKFYYRIIIDRNQVPTGLKILKKMSSEDKNKENMTSFFCRNSPWHKNSCSISLNQLLSEMRILMF